MPPLLKSLSTCATNSFKNLMLLSKSERLSQLQGLRCCTTTEKMIQDHFIIDVDMISSDLRLGTGQSAQLVCPGGENPKWYNQIHTYIHTISVIINYSSVG